MKFNVKELPGMIKTFWSTPPKGRFLNLKEIMCFAGASLGVSFIVNIIQLLITVRQIPEVFQISVIHGPIICLSASVLGLLIQPLYGKLLQNSKSKWGRYKPFIIFLAPVISAFAILSTWQPQNLNESNRVIFAYCSCIPTLILWYIWFNTLNMMPGVITPNQQERTDVWSPINLVIGFAPTVMNFIKGFIRDHFLSEGNEYLAFRYMGLISVVIGFVLVMLIFKVKERIIETAENNEKVGMFQGLRMVFKNVPLMVLSLALILGCMKTVIEFDAEILGKLRYASDIGTGLKIFSSLTLITGFAVTPNFIILPFLTRKFNHRTIMIFWSALNTLGYLILASIGIENLPQGTVSAAVITVLRFIALFNGVVGLLPLMLTEIYDYQQWKTGKRLEGFIQAFAYHLVLVFTNIGLLAISFVQQAIGYEPRNYFNVSTVSEELMNIANKNFQILLWVSAVSAFLMTIVLFFYNLDKNKHKMIVEELERRSAEQGLNSPEEAGSDGEGGEAAEVTTDLAASVEDGAGA